MGFIYRDLKPESTEPVSSPFIMNVLLTYIQISFSISLDISCCQILISPNNPAQEVRRL